MDVVLVAGMSELLVSNLGLIALGVCVGLVAICGVLANIFRKKYGKESVLADIFEAFASGVSESQEEIVRDAKKAAEDGKLSKEERKQAVEHALGIAKDVATGEAGKQVAKMGVAEARKWVGRVLAGRKKGMAETNAKTAEAKSNEAQAKVHEAALKMSKMGITGGTDAGSDT